MNKFPEENQLEVIEVPPELRGLSDEEIIKMSERELRPVSGRRKNGARRPSKRERLAMKQEKAHLENEKQAQKLFNEGLAQYNKTIQFSTTNFIYKKIAFGARRAAETNQEGTEPRRVLKASFGAKTEEKTQGTTLSTAELAKRRVEERAKKIREALMNRKQSENAEAQVEAPPASRPRGRPKKEPENP